MTTWGFDDNETDNQGNDTNQPGGLRQFAEKQQLENKELKAQLASIQDQLRKQSLQSVFSELGVPGAVNLYQGDADPEKAKAWVNDMRSTFGGNIQGTPNTTPAVETPEPEGLPSMLQNQMDKFTQAGQQGQPLGSFEQAQANINDATDLQGLINAMNSIR